MKLSNILEGIEYISSINPSETDNIDIEDIVNKFHSIDNVISTHHNHIWSLDSEHHVLSTHIKVPDDLTLEEITEVKKQARDSLDNLGIEHTTIEIELESESVPR